MDEVSAWLKSIELEDLYEKFENEAITMAELVKMRHEDLKEIGVDKYGHRQKILNAVENLNQFTEENSSDDAANEYITQYTDIPRNSHSSTERGSCSSDVSTLISSERDIYEFSETLQSSPKEGSNLREVSTLISSERDIYEFPETLQSSPKEGSNLREVSTENTERDKEGNNRSTNKTASAKFTEVLQKIQTFKIKACDMLSRTYKDLSTMLHGHVLTDELNKELYEEYGDIDKIIAQGTKDLEEFTCPIVVTGETSESSTRSGIAATVFFALYFYNMQDS